MKKVLSRHHSSIISIVLIALLSLINSFSKDLLGEDMNLNDTITTEIANDFLEAVNSGERDKMQDFILKHYDQNSLKRIPLFAVVSLNMGFYYQTGGSGYDLYKTLLRD